MLALATLALLVLLARRARAAPPPATPAAQQESSVPQRAPDARERRGFAALVGNTKLVRLVALSEETGCDILVRCARVDTLAVFADSWCVQAKAEFENPGGTSKDRVARQIVEDAEGAGVLRPGGEIVEGTSGSTGISLALMAASRGYKCTVFMPDDVAMEKATLLTTLGATVHRVKPVSIVHPQHYVNLARAYAARTPGALFTDQFENPSNTRAHEVTTGPEVWQQTNGRVDAFVMGAGTGGTIAGVSRFLKSRKAGVRVVLVDPPGSSLFNKVKHGVCFAEQQAESRIRRHRCARPRAVLAGPLGVPRPRAGTIPSLRGLASTASLRTLAAR